MRCLLALSLYGATACATARSAPLGGCTGAFSDASAATAGANTAAIRAVVATHYARPDSVVGRSVTIRADTALALLGHGPATATLVVVERQAGCWRVVREAGELLR